jgi:hypothetical protein
MPKSIAVFGAGPGLGQAVARRYAREGYEVTLVARRQEPIDRLAKELRLLRRRADLRLPRRHLLRPPDHRPQGRRPHRRLSLALAHRLPGSPLAVQQSTFLVVEAAPDAEILVGIQRERQAALPYRAARADGLGPLDFLDGRAGLPDREEQFRVRGAAGRQFTPGDAAMGGRDGRAQASPRGGWVGRFGQAHYFSLAAGPGEILTGATRCCRLR